MILFFRFILDCRHAGSQRPLLLKPDTRMEVRGPEPNHKRCSGHLVLPDRSRRLPRRILLDRISARLIATYSFAEMVDIAVGAF